jgi:hypothetical protein
MSQQLPNQLQSLLTGASGTTRQPTTLNNLIVSRESGSGEVASSQQRLVDLLSFANTSTQGARIVQSLFPNQTAAGGSQVSSIPTLARSQPARTRAQPTRAQAAQQTPASLHPNFRRKTVCSVSCKYCTLEITIRGMKAILLAGISFILTVRYSS